MHRRRLIAASFLAAAALGTSGTAVAAGPGGQSLDAQVSGPLTGTTTWQFTTNGCDFVHQVYEGTYEAASGQGTGSLRVEGCVEGTTTFPFTGTWTLTTPTGATLTGTASGPTNATNPATPEFTLVVTSGTRQLTPVTGTIGLTMRWMGGDELFGPDPVTGTLDGSLTRGGGRPVTPGS